jgi:ABC-type transport system involved in multi-copper enzyme maturation permease subunit
MGIDNLHYHGWNGRLGSPWWSSLSIVRVALLQVFRRKSYWVVLALGLLNFLLFWSIIYAVTQFEIPRDAQEGLLERFGFSSKPIAGGESGYIVFMQRQSIVVMILLAFSGSLLVGTDFRWNALPFYLSRRIDRVHYIFGKILAVGVIVSLLTTLPALVLYLEYGLFTASTEYWISNWRILVSILTYGLVMCIVLGTLLVTISAYLQRVAPIAITWSSLFVMLRTMANQLHNATGNIYWELIDPWRNMRYVSRLVFDAFPDEGNRELGWWALLILVVACGVSLALLVRRVRAVDVVT